MLVLRPLNNPTMHCMSLSLLHSRPPRFHSFVHSFSLPIKPCAVLKDCFYLPRGVTFSKPHEHAVFLATTPPINPCPPVTIFITQRVSFGSEYFCKGDSDQYAGTFRLGKWRCFRKPRGDPERLCELPKIPWQIRGEPEIEASTPAPDLEKETPLPPPSHIPTTPLPQVCVPVAR